MVLNDRVSLRDDRIVTVLCQGAGRDLGGVGDGSIDRGPRFDHRRLRDRHGVHACGFCGLPAIRASRETPLGAAAMPRIQEDGLTKVALRVEARRMFHEP